MLIEIAHCGSAAVSGERCPWKGRRADTHRIAWCPPQRRPAGPPSWLTVCPDCMEALADSEPDWTWVPDLELDDPEPPWVESRA